MKIEEQVLSIDQMNHLKELGLEVEDTAICIIPNEYNKPLFYIPSEVVLQQDKDRKVNTLTLQEILELLPKSIICKEVWHGLYIDYECMNISYSYMDLGGMSAEETFPIKNDKSASLMETAYSTLCWVLENGYLKS